MCLIQLSGSERWTVHNRLQELGIASNCRTGQPLYVQIDTPKEAIQLWSVTRLNKSSRCELISWLNFCLEQPINKI